MSIALFITCICIFGVVHYLLYYVVYCTVLCILYYAGQGNVAAGVVADAMLDAVIDVVGKMPGSSLELVRIVIFQAPMLPEFHKSMQRREGLGPGAKPGVVSWVMCKSSCMPLFQVVPSHMFRLLAKY